MEFYSWYLKHVRLFAKDHPSITFIEVSLDSEDTPKILEDKIGIPSECWGHIHELFAVCAAIRRPEQERAIWST